MIAINIDTPTEVAPQLAARVKARRLELNLTQEGMAIRAGIKFATYRRFEHTSELQSLSRIAYAVVGL